MEKLGNAIKKALVKKELNQRDLARYLDVSPTSVNSWVLGKQYPTFEKVLKIVEYLEIDEQILPQKKASETQQNQDTAPISRTEFMREIRQIYQKLDAIKT